MSRFNADNPYNDLPLLPPLVELETKAVLKRAIAANTALAVCVFRANLTINSDANRPPNPIQTDH